MENEQVTFSGHLGDSFQSKLIWQLLTDHEFSENIIEHIKPYYFDDPTKAKFFMVMLQYFQDQGKPPNLLNKSIETAIKMYTSASKSDYHMHMNTLESINTYNEGVINGKFQFDGDVVKKSAFLFVKQQEYDKVADEIKSDIRAGVGRMEDSIMNIEKKLKIVSEIGDNDNYGSDVFEDMDEALKKTFREPIPTGILGLDTITGGGLGKGEIGLLLAPSGVGKTTFLSKVANNAYDVGKNVLQIIFEDSENEIKRKHYAIWSGIKLSEIDEKRDEVHNKVVEYISNHKKDGTDNVLRIVRLDEATTTMHDIRNFIIRYQKKFGIKFDIIILDYIDCIEPHQDRQDQNRAELAIIKSFISLANEFDVPCWSAVQANREGFNSEFVQQHHTGGSIKRVQKSNLFISVNKSNEQKQNGTANISVLKARFAKDGQEYQDSIYDNDTLEIRFLDTKKPKARKRNNLTLPEHDPNDLNKLAVDPVNSDIDSEHFNIDDYLK
jgi:replicative DNA helicase